MKTYATASIPKYLIYTFSAIRLEEICQENLVCLKALRYTENQVVCKLYGLKEDIKAAIKNLYKEINEESKKNSQLIRQKSKRIPEELRASNELLNNDENYRKCFEEQADRYIRHCNINDINPHPEVWEDFVL